MEECQILPSRETMQLRAIAIRFSDIMLTEPSVMDVDTNIRERLDDFNIVSRHKQKGTWEGDVSSLNLSWSLTS